MINVTKVYLPEQSKFSEYVSDIYKRNWVTNNGPLVNNLELKLKDFLQLNHLLLVTNGTVAIQLAIKALELSGEIITTPFSYVATTSSIVWEQCKPVFVDIRNENFNIDETKIENAISKNTTAILATHVFGNPCAIDEIEKIAQKHNLKVIYDAAHCFGTQYKGRSILEYGDISTTSFHATKIFHTVEGGAVITKSATLLKKLSLLRNFGHTSPITFENAGINAKNSEFHAAMGLCVLEDFEKIQKKREDQWKYYYTRLKNSFNGKLLSVNNETTNYNYAYFPIVFSNEKSLLETIEALQMQYVFPRRYFYPSLNTLHYVDYQECEVSEEVAKCIICLPLYHDLTQSEQDMIIRIILRVQNN